MHIETVPNRGARPTILLRQSYRDGRKVCKRTLANLTCLPPEVIETLRQALRGDRLLPSEKVWTIERSVPHGHVAAVLGTIGKLGLDTIIASRRSRRRDLIVAMIAERLLHGGARLAGGPLWHTSTLAEELSVQDAEVDELDEVIPWLRERQEHIERKLSTRHFGKGAPGFHCINSSAYVEGYAPVPGRFRCPCTGEKGRPMIVYGVLTDRGGCPVAVHLYPEDTGIPSTLGEQVNSLRERLGIARVVLVGDRRILPGPQIEKLREYPGLGWISTVRRASIRKLLGAEHFSQSLRGRQTATEITSDEFPGERLVACFNPLVADERVRKRKAFLAVTEERLQRIVHEVARRTKNPLRKGEIELKVGKVINGDRAGRYFGIVIEDGLFRWERDEASIEDEAVLDGIVVVRTSEPKKRLSAADAVRSYESLGQAEQDFRLLAGIDIGARPIHQSIDQRVRAHLFLGLLAYYVEWHMRSALDSLMPNEEKRTATRKTDGPGARVEPSKAAQGKKRYRSTPRGLPVHSFDDLLGELGTLCRNHCRLHADSSGGTFTHDTRPTGLQARVFQLLGL